jgi:predicted transcriptional regulator
LDEKTENLNQRLAVLEEDKDALMAAPIATSIGINIDTTDEKHTASRRRRTESAKTK